MRLEKCWFCSATIYPGHGMKFVRNDCTLFSFCRSKCHNNFKMKRNPRKVKWTKAYRRIHKKELPDDPLTEFAKKRSKPVKYNPNVVGKTLKTIERVKSIRVKKEQRYNKERTKKAKMQEKEHKLNFIDSHLNLIAAPKILGNGDLNDKRKNALKFLRDRRRKREEKIAKIEKSE
ncbi:hypothetical protein MHBO_000782 [Bonamia ostreae]|uniref:TRASH domain-containing protein n=1 Tax=Bonamia ostreae TaxID=126728 RepID=A0ABV2AGW0_9EUKA